ncbi:MAG: nitronate monooxygenase [Epulopiscium sp.]|nr:nitronate monooxygenase [Candidatus Epulonipiscium sp.]
MKISPLQIGSLFAPVPIVQGGMGVGISLSGLASAVANAGGIGVISGIQIGFQEPDFYQNSVRANQRALRKEIQKAKEQSPKGIIGVNFLTAMQRYTEMVKIAVEEKIDIIFSGAGLPVELPALIQGSQTKIIPIVSSAKAAAVITKLWGRKYNYLPDAIVVEGPEAGGHLGFSREELEGNTRQTQLPVLIQEVKKVLQPFEAKANRKVPLIAAGGIFTGADIAKVLKLGASGVQMGTRFIATEECDAPPQFKQLYIGLQKGQIGLINSPVGLPGRALQTSFTEEVAKHSIPVKKCLGCLKTCNPKETPYCISEALVQATKGNQQEGLFFAGTNAYRMKEIVKVEELIGELMKEIHMK